jgi:hypothetical protein
MHDKWKCVIAAGFGAIMPTIFKLAYAFITYPSEPPPQVRYYIGIAILFLIGACIAFMFEENNMKKAVFLGLSLPGLISSAGPINSPIIKSPQRSSGTLNFVTNSYALEKVAETNTKELHIDEQTPVQLYDVNGIPTTATYGSNRSTWGWGSGWSWNRGSNNQRRPNDSLYRKIDIDFQSEMSSEQVRPVEIEINAITDSAKVKAAGKFKVYPNTIIHPLISLNTTSIIIKSGNITGKLDYPVRDKGTIALTVDLSYKPKNDFLWALGFNREMVLSAIKLKERPLKKLHTIDEIKDFDSIKNFDSIK